MRLYMPRHSPATSALLDQTFACGVSLDAVNETVVQLAFAAGAHVKLHSEARRVSDALLSARLCSLTCQNSERALSSRGLAAPSLSKAVPTTRGPGLGLGLGALLDQTLACGISLDAVNETVVQLAFATGADVSLHSEARRVSDALCSARFCSFTCQNGERALSSRGLSAPSLSKAVPTTRGLGLGLGLGALLDQTLACGISLDAV